MDKIIIDLTEKNDKSFHPETRHILTCCLNLSRNDMLESLMAECILIHGNYYRVPESDLLECLQKKLFGNIKLELEQIENN